MATTTKAKYDAKNAFYVYLGAGQFLWDKSRELSKAVPGKVVDLAKNGRENFNDQYKDLAHRGEKLAKSIRGSAYTKRAVEQTKTARTQVKAAATSVRKAVNSTAEATKQAAKKVS